MHHGGIVLARENVSGAAHIGSELIEFVDSFDGQAPNIFFAEVTEKEFISVRIRKLMLFYVRAANPVPLRFQPLYQVATDETTCATNQNSFFIHEWHHPMYSFRAAIAK
jgi:hypothetical protein